MARANLIDRFVLHQLEDEHSLRQRLQMRLAALLDRIAQLQRANARLKRACRDLYADAIINDREAVIRVPLVGTLSDKTRPEDFVTFAERADV